MDTHESCQAGNRAALRGTIHVPWGAGSTAVNGGEFLFFREEGRSMYQALYRKWRPKVFSEVGGTGAHHGYPPPSGGRGPYRPRLSLHRHTGYRQDHLCPDIGQGGELSVPGGRRALRPVRGLPGRGCRHHAGYHGAGRRQQQRRGSGPCAAGGGGVYPCGAKKSVCTLSTRCICSPPRPSTPC